VPKRAFAAIDNNVFNPPDKPSRRKVQQ
jgi:hypothetical protein